MMAASRGAGVDWESAYRALIGDSGVTEVVIPEGVTYIRPYAIYNTNLTRVVLPQSFKTPGTYDNFVVGKNSKLTSLELGGLTKISESMFRENTALASVTIPASVNEIRAYAFAGCTALTSVVLERESVLTLNYNVPQIFPNSAIFYVPDALLDAYKSANRWSAIADRIKPLSELVE